MGDSSRCESSFEAMALARGISGTDSHLMTKVLYFIGHRSFCNLHDHTQAPDRPQLIINPPFVTLSFARSQQRQMTISLVLFDALHTLVKPRAPIFLQYANVFEPHLGKLNPDAIKSSFKTGKIRNISCLSLLGAICITNEMVAEILILVFFRVDRTRKKR